MPKGDDLEIEFGNAVRRPPGPSRPSLSPKRLEKLFGDPLPQREAAMWSLMDTAQRARALQRADALVRYRDGEGDVPARTAAADAGVTLVRFYQMNARWRDRPSLAALGVGAQPEKARRSQFSPELNAMLQSAVSDIVRDDKASVRALATKLADAVRSLGVPEGEVPGHNTLRAVVERARRDRGRRGQVGNELLFDHAACGIARPSGAPWTVFVIADAASQLILGAAPGDAGSVALGYSDAARDAIRRIGDPAFARVPWADRLSGVQLVPGSEGAAAFDGIVSKARSIGIGMNLTADRKAGRYLERLAGRAIGVLPIWPARVGAAEVPSWAVERMPSLDPDRAQARIILAVEDHNAEIMSGGDGDASGQPPPGLAQLLDTVAR